MKILTSFIALQTNGADRISYTYDEVDDETGAITSANVKESFVVTNPNIRGHLTSIRNFIANNKLSEE